MHEDEKERWVSETKNAEEMWKSEMEDWMPYILDLEMVQNVEIQFFERIWDHVDVGFQDIPTINL